MILLFGSHGYVGSAIAQECDRRGIEWLAATRFRKWDGEATLQLGQQVGRCDLVINAAAFIPNPTVDACKDHPVDTLIGNVELPLLIRDICEIYSKPMMQLSTGCLFNEYREYTEDEAPTRTWDGYCGFYVGTKLLCERIVCTYEKHYILRLRLPFDEFDSPRSYINKMAGFRTVFTHNNSLTHRGDFAKSALDLWEKRAAFGTYHVCCEGQITALELVSRMLKKGLIKKVPEYVQSDTTGCLLSVNKLKSAGVSVRHVSDAIEESLAQWKA